MNPTYERAYGPDPDPERLANGNADLLEKWWHGTEDIFKHNEPKGGVEDLVKEEEETNE